MPGPNLGPRKAWAFATLGLPESHLMDQILLEAADHILGMEDVFGLGKMCDEW